RRRHTRSYGDWSSDVCSSDLSLVREQRKRARLCGTGCDTQFLFSDDILGDYDERLPRHAKAYRNFLEEHRRLQRERIAAFGEYRSEERRVGKEWSTRWWTYT